jgi:hypothetical protein
MNCHLHDPFTLLPDTFLLLRQLVPNLFPSLGGCLTPGVSSTDAVIITYHSVAYLRHARTVTLKHVPEITQQ